MHVVRTEVYCALCVLIMCSVLGEKETAMLGYDSCFGLKTGVSKALWQFKVSPVLYPVLACNVFRWLPMSNLALIHGWLFFVHVGPPCMSLATVLGHCSGCGDGFCCSVIYQFGDNVSVN